MDREISLGVCFAAAVALAACAPSDKIALHSDPKAGFADVRRSISGILRKDTAILLDAEAIAANAARVRGFVHRETISADTAVQVALLNNRGLQASYARLGVSSADVWQSVMQPNPAVSIGAFGIGAEGVGSYRSIEGMIAFHLLSLFTRADRTAMAELRFSQAQLQAVEDTLAVALGARRSWIESVAAFEISGLIRQAEETANAGSELAARLGDTGFLNKAEQAREHAFYAEISAQRARARLDAQLAKERLTRTLGLWGSDIDFYVPNSLPRLPSGVRSRPAIEADALRNRVDLAIARLELQAAARSRGLTEATRFVSDLELLLGVEREKEVEDGDVETESTRQIEVEFEIPVFDSGKARLKRAESAYLVAAHELAEMAVNVRSEARSAYAAYTGTYRIARHYRQNVLPLRKTIEEEALLSYNAMITSTFQLLADTRERLNSSLSEVRARRDFWLADADILGAIYGGGTAGPGGGGAASIAAGGGGEH